MTSWLVDGMNVVGARPDGWWRDRRAAMRRLAGELRDFAEAGGDEVAVVFDGRPFEVDAAPVEVGFAARRGRNAADDEIVRRVARHPDAGTLTVVTSDRELERRVTELGARVVGAGEFRRRLDAV